MSNENLKRAKNAKNDEFYTQYADIQKEINAYIEYDPDVFRDKTILLPCDDPEWSNFTKFFCLNFDRFGLKKLISTSYAFDSKKLSVPYQASMFEETSPQYEKSLSASRGKIFTLERGERKPSPESLVWRYLDGDGDFRSKEVTALRDEADIIVTNPPFSLFREFFAWIMAGGKKFLVIGSIGATSYKEVFPLIKNNRIWLGTASGAMRFRAEATSERQNIEKGSDGQTYAKFGNICWFTNLDHGRRHEPLVLMSMADNLKYTRHKELKSGYKRYDNYDAIEVPFTDSIPKDYKGVMGVPISFLDKYCPEQFEIIGTDSPYYIDELGIGRIGERWIEDYKSAGGTGHMTANMRSLVYRDADKKAVSVYKRILVRYTSSWISSHPEDFECV